MIITIIILAAQVQVLSMLCRALSKHQALPGTCAYVQTLSIGAGPECRVSVVPRPAVHKRMLPA